METFGLVFSLDSRPKPTPGTPLDRRGPPRTSTSTKNQPRKPLLRLLGGTRKNPARLPSGYPLAQKQGQIPVNLYQITRLGCLFYAAYTWFLMHDFLTDRKSSILGVWAPPGGRENLPKGGRGRSPLSFWKVSRPPGAAQTPKIDDLRSVKKSYTKSPGVRGISDPREMTPPKKKLAELHMPGSETGGFPRMGLPH